MPILNYTTQIAAEKTLAQIQAMLAKAKARAIMLQFDADGLTEAISFQINSGNGLLSFRLPCNTDQIYRVLQGNSKVPRRLQTRAQATCVAWRIVKDWLEAQLAIIEAGLVTTEQAFLPYALNASGKTLYETLKAQSFAPLLKN